MGTVPASRAAVALPAWRRSPAPLLALTLAFLAFLLVPRVANVPGLTRVFTVTGLALLAAEALLWMRSRARGHVFTLQVGPVPRSHWIQGLVQLCIYAYWGWYWRDVYGELPLIAAQFVFLTIVEALISWFLQRTWRLGLGALPIVLSTNVFIWFKDDWFGWQFALLVTAALSKEVLKWRRDGERVHIFNPSSFALGVFSLALIASNSTDLTWGQEIATTLFRPPHIYLQIFLLGLIVQYFFHVTLMTLSAAAVLVVMNLVYTAINGTYYFIDTNIAIAIFLGFHLLVTDPRTSPRTNPGRILFGALYGVAIWILYAWLNDIGAPQFYDKLLPIPILNLCVRWIDRVTSGGLAGAFDRWEARFPAARVNLAHMGCWTALFAGMLATGFVEAPHPGDSIAYWKQKVDEGRPGAPERLLMLVRTRVAKGSPSAANALGALYMDGQVVARDAVAAAQWFARACELGNERGCVNVARAYLLLGQAASPEAVDQALAALEQGCGPESDGEGCALVGYAYETGRGRPVDLDRAAELFAAGAERGNLEAAKSLARVAIREHRAYPGLDVAEPLLQQACDAGDAQGCLYLAQLVFDGLGVALDGARVHALLTRACDLGSKEACGALSNLGN